MDNKIVKKNLMEIEAIHLTNKNHTHQRGDQIQAWWDSWSHTQAKVRSEAKLKSDLKLGLKVNLEEEPESKQE